MVGKSDINTVRKTQKKAMILRGKPALPRLKGEGRRVSPRIRFLSMQPRTTRYDPEVPTIATPRMMLKAMFEPMRRREHIADEKSVNRTALTGTS